MANVAVERVRRAATKGETVGLIGDYDCDGLTSSAMLVRSLRRLGIDPIVRIPHRLNEGYGVQMTHIDDLHARGVTLLLTTDTGIVAVDQFAHARDLGMDAIILDHHAFVDVPPAFAILHPALTTLSSAPAAAGIAIAFAHALHGDDWQDRGTDVALAAIGTVADVVPLTGDNRTIVREGLRAFTAMGPDTPLGYLRDRSGIKGMPTSTDIAFRIAPRLNAAGRLGEADIALRALLGDLACVDQLEELNARRQALTRSCMDEALTSVNPSTLPACICVASENFPKGIVGLVAGKLAETYGRPAAAIAIENGMCTASLRGIPGYDIAAGLRAHADLFTTFGGHAQAGGCTFTLARLPAVMDALARDVTRTVDVTTLHPVLHIDAHISQIHASLAFTDGLAALEPFGSANPEPVFLLPSVTLSGIRRVGSDQRHLQARVGAIGAIGFGLGHLSESLAGTVDLACRITANEWNSTRRPQLSLVDLRQAVQTGASFPSISNTAITGTLRAEAIL